MPPNRTKDWPGPVAREWISPSKSVEGLIGGTVGTFLAVAIIGTQDIVFGEIDR